MRLAISLLVLVAGVVLGILSYFVFAAPLGVPTNEGFSNPRVPFAATIFLVGVSLVFLSVLVYELFPNERHR